MDRVEEPLKKHIELECFAPTLIYDIPYSFENGESACHKEDCLYLGRPHRHELGLTFLGAKVAAELCGIETELSVPKLFKFDGRDYWVVMCRAVDVNAGKEASRIFRQPATQKTPHGEMRDEQACLVAQFEAERGAIMALLPAEFVEAWIEEYKAGKLTLE